jgi:tetratricopeptide (TPR) repeat protein
MADRRPAGYEKTLMEYQSRFPRDGLSEYVLWIVGAEAVKRGERERAVALFEQGTAQFPRGEYSDRMRFWLYKLYREIGKTAEAEKKFRELSVYNPDSSYTWRVLQEHAQARDEARLEEEFDQGLNKRDPSLYLHSHLLLLVKQKDLDKRDQRIRRLPRSATGAFFTLGQALDGFEVRHRYREQLARLEKYFAVGHADGINRELGILPPDDRAQADRNIALAHFGSRYNHHYFSVYFTLEALRHAGLQENIALLPASTVRRLLPFSFGECTTRYSMESRIPATEILAVMKAESLFNHRAVSSARAVGLMQLMPSTARDIARRLNVKKYDLTDPCTSIRFGAHYLSWLDRMFNGRFE